MKLKGAEALLECLKEQEVDVVFGYPGGTVLPIYDALYDYREIKHIITAHEQGATHAADGYARATGKVGVVIATSGPGATNTVTGIATAYRDSVPIVVITGQVSRNLLDKDSFQEVDIVSITSTITKKSYQIKEAEDIPRIVREAFELARSGRPGPVLIDIPKDLQTLYIDYEPDSIDVSYNPEKEISCDDSLKEQFERNLIEAIEIINNSERPMIFAGGGVNISGANNELLRFAEKIKAPVTCSLMGMGAFPGNHPYFTGMVGMHGTKYSNIAINNCDVLIAVGVRFSDRVVSNKDSFAKKAKIIHIDIDQGEFGKIIQVDTELWGDVKNILINLNEKVKEKEESEWNKQIQHWKESYPLKYKNNGGVSPKKVLEMLYELSEGKVIITTEVGQNQIWAAQFYKYLEPRTFISSGGLGTMGYGLGAAIGASIGKPGTKVVNVAGDGSFKMNSIELATVSRNKLPIIQLVFNNHALGMVRQWQDLFYGGRFFETTLGPDVDFVDLAKAYKIKAVKIDEDDKIEKVLKEALESDEPILIECDIHCDDKVFPIVPPGEAIHNTIETA
ncbi:biosynthetic-type acetolactate synthase large subunit [Clostridium sp. SYSU_GA19001]|uniref:biosynthetic-type acetolactate synthase large subunit n=1 Tax=Clostridium caldaquaticum TaxID=2940653 RepID=UPI00207736D0|nr:biosynthetic-type acetolactate synthase large subunit [Clostridium caldaquaticum]MCM8710905.1 biosynthetic-type acetolactate synthase large subunit [Clostridium caldaquaticum]